MLEAFGRLEVKSTIQGDHIYKNNTLKCVKDVRAKIF